LNIEAAFDSTSNVTIKQAMIRHEIPQALVDWTKNMLAGRNLTITGKESLKAHHREAVHREGFYPHYCGAS
jgi:hypothetical protein